MKKDALFSEFAPVSSKEWKQKIQVDLKGADYNQTLVWESLEGIKVKPFYTTEDTQGNLKFKSNTNHHWKIGQSIYAGNSVLANKKALDVLNRGAQAIIFIIPDSKVDWNLLFENLPLEKVNIHLKFELLDLPTFSQLQRYIEGKSCQIYIHADIIGQLAKTGNWFHSLQMDHEILDALMHSMRDEAGVSTLSIDLSLYQNAGATMVQQLAYGLAHANEYLNHFKEILNIGIEKPIVFNVAVGTNYFFEVAKLQALRWLWNSIKDHYGLKKDCHIVAMPSKRNKTIYDYNVNMLRTTSECMSAVLGGANTICNLPYDSLYHKENEFGDRIARNQLLLLREESFFDEAMNASEGAYYIDHLTGTLASKALVLFKQIEASGGFLGELKKGIIHKKIKESAEKEQQLFDEGQLVLLGTNRYQNPNDKMKDTLELYPFLKTDKRKTLIAPILERRLAEKLEQKRLNDE